MSRYNWESGQVKFSTKEYGAFRRGMVVFHNAQQDKAYTRALTIHDQLRLAAKGKRNFDFDAAFTSLVGGVNVEVQEAIWNALFPMEQQADKSWKRSNKLRAPKKAQFPASKLSATSIPVGSEAGISFDNKTRTIRWHVSENNHAVERAHHHPTGAEFFSRLDRVVWTRGTGGEFVGNDEYNSDSDSVGGGGNYRTRSYSMQDQKAAAKRNTFTDQFFIANAYRRGF